jgi:hypothetical protein
MVYQQGDHVCTVYDSPEEQLRAAIEYIQGGLARGERCLYVCGEHDVADFRTALKAAGVNVTQHQARGALLLVTKHDAHLKGGTFDPAAMIDLLNTAVQEALADGFTGLCAAGDMTWLLDEAPGSERIAEYEAALNHFYSANRALGLCQYHCKKLPAAVLDHCMATHRYVRVDGPILLENPFYELPETAIHRIPRPEGIQQRMNSLRPKTAH